MLVLPDIAIIEAIQDTPVMSGPQGAFRAEGKVAPMRICEDCSDFGDMATVGKKVCVGGDETYEGVFLGRNLRLGYLIGVPGKGSPNGFAYEQIEMFKTREDMLCRWLLKDGEEQRRF